MLVLTILVALFHYALWWIGGSIVLTVATFALIARHWSR